MNKEDGVHIIYSGILLGLKKEQIWVICRDLDGPTEINQKVLIIYYSTYVWNLEKWYR